VDRILIKDLLVRCIVGVNEDERTEKQDVVINIALTTDLRPAGTSDRFTDAVDYRAIKKRVYAMVEESRFFLVEALAEQIAAICLEDPRVQQVQVSVEKPTALRFARSVGVEITRTRDG
jgi:FolB domain-containing protein